LFHRQPHAAAGPRRAIGERRHGDLANGAARAPAAGTPPGRVEAEDFPAAELLSDGDRHAHFGWPWGAFEQGNSRRKQVRQLAHDHAIPHCHRGDLAHRAPEQCGPGCSNGWFGAFRWKKGPDMPGRGCSCVPTTGAGPERRHDSARSAAAASRKKWPRMSIRGQVGPSEGKTQQRWAPGSVSPLRGRPLAKARCFQGPGTAPRPWPPTAINIDPDCSCTDPWPR
jgi:hypothetical protein